MKTGWIEIKLKSDLCTATGDGSPGITDIEVTGEYGLPVIPAKRIKGCLRAAAEELKDHNMLKSQVTELMFGKTGMDGSGALYIYDAHIYEVPNLEKKAKDMITVGNYEKLVSELKAQEELKPREILESFTMLRTQTAMDTESGAALKTSLRTARVIKRGLVLRCKVNIQADGQEAQVEEALSMCTKALRNMGLGITRGMGEVQCRLIGMTECEVTRKAKCLSIDPACHGEEQIELHYELQLEMPVIFPRENSLYHSCEDWIPGSAVRGALAGMYIADRQLGNNAHEDEDFSRIFLREQVQFGYAFPLKNEKVFYPCAASVHRVKNEDLYYDLSGKKPEDIQLRGEKRLINLEENTIRLHEPAKQIRMHHARPKDRGIGHALADTGQPYAAMTPEKNAEMGQFFQYISLCEGQSFQGIWRGSGKDVQQLLECLHKRGNKLRLGRSRTAEYGEVSFHVKEAHSISAGKADHEEEFCRFTLWLVSPMALYDKETGRAAADPKILMGLLNETLNCGAKLEKAFPKFSEIAGYNTKWRLPKEKHPVLAEGSAFVIQTEKPVKRSDFETRNWGESIGEGCGMVKVITANKTTESLKELIWVPFESPPKTDKSSIQEDESEPSPLIKALITRKIRLEEERQQRTDALETVPEELNSTAIEQIIKMSNGKENYDYEQAVSDLKKLIKNDKKRNNAILFMKPCEGESSVFLKTYLQNAKWKTRKVKRDE